MAIGATGYAAIATAVAAATNTAIQYHQGEEQIAQSKKEFAYEKETAYKQEQAANEEAIAEKQALIAEQESMSNQQEVANENKKKTSYQRQYAAWNSTGEGFGLGSTSNGKLG